MKLEDLNEGDVIHLEGGFTCHGQGAAVVERTANGDLFYRCRAGKHFLDAQVDENGELSGVSK